MFCKKFFKKNTPMGHEKEKGYPWEPNTTSNKSKTYQS